MPDKDYSHRDILDKLGLKPGHAVRVVGGGDRALLARVREKVGRGLVRGGRFVSGFSGEQYALPAAHEQLTQTRRSPRAGERVTVNATDPLNLVGVIVPGARVPAVRTRRVTFVDGVVEDTDERVSLSS